MTGGRGESRSVMRHGLKFLLLKMTRHPPREIWEMECLGCSRRFWKLGSRSFRKKMSCKFFPGLCFLDQVREAANRAGRAAPLEGGKKSSVGGNHVKKEKACQ
jgi:hypothetical protein